LTSHIPLSERGRRPRFAGALGDQAGGELGDGAQDVEEHPPDGGGSVDALVQHHQVHTSIVQGLGQLYQVLERTAEPI
jgi:hypothetical protein